MNEVFARLVGAWSGEGRGVFPTIDAFTFRETLTVEQRDEASLFYVQKSARAPSAGSEWITSHWESGFIRRLDDHTFDLVSAQSGGRTEVLRGIATTSGPRLIIEFQSTAISNDPRMIASARRWEIEGETLRYTMAMATTRVPELTDHLSAVLTRGGAVTGVSPSDSRLTHRPTTPADIEFVVATERAGGSADFVLQWSREKHLAALADPNVAHWILETRDANPRAVGFVILAGVEPTGGVVEFKRVVVAEKGSGFGQRASPLRVCFASTPT
jgi:hypothetical protein